MSVNLSPVAGAAAQFLDNSGNVLTGGKLYTYAAGTTTPQATYTSSAGDTFHTNPIILDAAGRVPNGGEIWLADGLRYKFVLKDANDVLIGSWDNLIGINSNFVNYSTQEQTLTATQGQTVFTLTTVNYTPGTNSLNVFVNGSKQIVTTNYLETNSTTVTFLSGLNVGDVVDFTTAILLAAGVTTSNLIIYNEGATGAVNRTVQSKLQETVSVKDFGAVGDGVANDTAAIQAAHTASTAVYYPQGTYKISSSIVLPSGARVIGECANSAGGSAPSTIISATTSAYAYTMDAPVNTTIEGPRFSNIQINAQNGVRLNTTTGGQPGISGATQGFINNASFRKTFINQDGATVGTGLQASVCFHLEFTEQSEIRGFSIGLDVYYSDFVLISHVRLWQFTTALIRLTAANTFGSHSIIENNDLLSGATSSTAFIICNDYNPTIRNNFIEQDAAQGTGLTAAIVMQSSTQKFLIEDNSITMPVACAPNWLNVTSTGSLGQLVISGNSLNGVGVGPALFNSGTGLQPYFNGGNGITVCNHFGNTFETGIPFNTVNRSTLPNFPYKTVSVLTPSFYGSLQTSNYGANAYIKDNNLVIPASAGGNLVFFKDPNNVLTQNVSVYVLAYASGAQSITATVYDGGGSPSGVALSITTKPTWFQVTASYTAATELSISFYNATSGGANTVYIQSIVINTP